ncbi:MAG TPA: hypothetical protein VH538_07605 [Gaiellaceae bacterium]|jgi:hypothetical protein
MAREKRFDTMRPPEKSDRREDRFDTMASGDDQGAAEGGEQQAPAEPAEPNAPEQGGPSPNRERSV